MQQATTAAKLPPGPTAPVPFQTLRWVFRPAPFMREAWQRFGDVFTIRFGGDGPMVFVCDPELVKQIYTTSPELAHAGEARRLIEPLVGSHSVLLLDEAPHMRQRKLMLPAFHGERMKAYRELMVGVTERELERWPRGEPFAVLPSMQAITLDVIMQAVFGVASGERYERLRAVLLELLATTTNPLTMLVVLGLRFTFGVESRRTGFDRNLAGVDELIFEEIRERRADGGVEERTDVLSLLMQARDEDGRGLGDQELRDELVTLLIAGHETTATTLGWALERVLRHPDVHERLASGVEPEYVDAIVKETLRLRPVIPITPRKPTVDLQLGEHTIPAGELVAPCIWLIHRRPDVYPDPLRFRPERFLGQSPGTYTWIPFGGGVRRCLGATFAMFESTVVLETIFRHVRLRAVEPQPERIRRRAVTFAPNRGAQALVEREPRPRASAGAARARRSC